MPEKAFAKSSLLILYGSETGTARDCSEHLVEFLRYCHIESRLFSFDDFPFEQLVDESAVLFVVATCGQGQLPANMRRNWRKMLARRLPQDFFQNMSFAVAGLGDSSYAEYNFASKKLYRRLRCLGAQELFPLALCDDQASNGLDEGFELFKENVTAALAQTDLFPNMQTFDDSVLLPPKFRLQFVDETEVQEEKELEAAQLFRHDHTQTLTGFSRMEVLRNERVTAESHFQDTRLITLHNASEIHYKPGHVVQVQPENLDEIVEATLEYLEIPSDVLDRPFWIEKSNQSVLMPPEHMIEFPTTLRTCFQKLFDIHAIPTRHFFNALARVSKNEMETEKLQELADFKSIDDFIDYVRLPRRSITEVLRDFPATARNIPIERIFDIFPIIRPRSFSIASSHLASSQELQLLVARVEYGRKNMRSRRLGLCSNFLARIQTGRTIATRIIEGTMDFDRPGTHRVCIATGTGVAPFRSLIAESSAAKETNPILLFFGCRSRNADFYFAEEWPQHQNTTVHPAFSRDQTQKIYVQNILEKEVALLGQLVQAKQVTFYVAGSSGQMPKDVRAALCKVLETTTLIDEFGASSKDLLARMETERLVQFETWF